ncbi:MAG: DUF4924 family protein [Rikenellaceae bacterium]|nr:DUF4924 family protein [Rikenellaceae bacterium]
MNIAQAKRKENIAEYILYLWQIEDLLRALQFSPEAIYTQLVEPRQVDEQTKQTIFLWYMDIVNLLREEGKERIGHLEHTLHLINDMQHLHLQLMELPAGERYRPLYLRLAPYLPALRSRMGKQETGDIELCFRALYAAMLYRIKGGKGSDEPVSDVLEYISPVIAELAKIYRQVETGEIDLFRDRA